jgi:hypothetical protein
MCNASPGPISKLSLRVDELCAGNAIAMAKRNKDRIGIDFIFFFI